jgi:GT2 family glycosyltransferase
MRNKLSLIPKLRVSVVIPTKDRTHSLCKAIDSIVNQTLLPDEIILVDSSKKIDDRSFLKDGFTDSIPLVKFIWSNQVLTVARNIGIEHSSGDVIFFFDDDVVLDRDYIKEVVKVFMNDPREKIAGVMGNIRNLKRDTSSLTAIVRRLFFLDHFGDGKFLPSGLPTYVHGQEKKLQTEFLSGCTSAYRRKVLNEFAFDEKLGKLSGYCYLEDADMSYRVSRKYNLVYTPLARLEHHPSVKAGLNMMIRTKQLVTNHYYLFNKNIPKQLSAMLAFCLSLLGHLLVRGLFPLSGKAIIGWFQGIFAISTGT